MKNFFKSIGIFLIAILVIFVITVASIGMDVMGIRINGFLNKEQAKVERETFTESTAYVEGMIEDLANYKLEYDRAESDADKAAIAGFIADKYANFDAADIKSDGLREFLYDCRGF